MANAQDKYGRTPLYLAAGCGYIEIAKYLVEDGANIHVQDEERKTPLALLLAVKIRK